MEKVSTTEDLLPLALAISHNQAVQRIRYNKAEKRDVTVTDSLDGFDAPDSSGSLRELDLQDLRAFIKILMQDLLPRQRVFWVIFT